jgi:hypothetical protein
MQRQMLKSNIRHANVNARNEVVAVDSDPSVLLGERNQDQEALL